jgi:peptidoglycan-associated lipoprotein
MRTTFLIPIAGIALAAACHSTPSREAAAPQPTPAEIALQRHVQDSLDAVNRAIADSVERARQAELANRARADSIERERLAVEAATRKASDEAAAKNAALREELGVMVHFDLAQARIQADDRAALDRKVAILNANPTVRLQITGACDDRGSDQYNLALGHRRATAVKRYLVGKRIDAARLDEMSFGEKSPIDSGRGEAAWARNRRAEFVIVSGDTLTMAQPAMAEAKQPPVAPAMAQPAMTQAKRAPLAPAIAQLAMAQATKPPVMPHEKAGREQCAMCHSGAMEGIKAMPADHKGRGNEVCTLCHAKDSPVQTAAAPAPAMPHDVAGREQCMMCHGGTMEGIKAAPASHKGIDAKNCTLCHTEAKKG